MINTLFRELLFSLEENGFASAHLSESRSQTNVINLPTFYPIPIALELLQPHKQSIPKLYEELQRILLDQFDPQTQTCNWLIRSLNYNLASQQYPDDLDDTAVAWIALASIQQSLDPKKLAVLTQTLISCEQSEGGPYSTWVVNTEDSVWNDCDPVVNANIARMLTKLGVNVDPLHEWILSAIEKNIASPYYKGTQTQIYFLLRYFEACGEYLSVAFLIKYQTINAEVITQARKALKTSIYDGEKLMLISGLARVKEIEQDLIDEIPTLKPAWFPFCLDHQKSDGTFYSGTKLLAEVFLLDVLHSLQSKTQKEEGVPVPQRWKKIISLLPQMIADSYQEKITPVQQKQIQKLLDLLLNAWIVFTAFDDLYDKDNDTIDFHTILPKLDRMYAISHDLQIQSLVSQQIARWLAHLKNHNKLVGFLSFEALILAQILHVPHSQIKACLSVLDLYESISQLHDDLHDCVEDWRAKRKTKVTTYLFRHVSENGTSQKLFKIIEKKAIPHFLTVMTNRVQLEKERFLSVDLLNNQPFLQIISDLEHLIDRARTNLLDQDLFLDQFLRDDA